MAFSADIRGTVPRLVDIEVTVAITSDVTSYTAIERMIFPSSATDDDITAAVQARLDALSQQAEPALPAQTNSAVMLPTVSIASVPSNGS